MPRILLLGDVIQFRVWSQDSEQAAVTTHHYAVTSAPTGSPTDDDAATSFEAAINTAYKAIMSSDARFNGMTSQVIFPGPIQIAQRDVTGAGSGTGGANTLPRQAAAITTWRTPLAGPGFRGRTYWPFIYGAANTTDGKPSAGFITALTSLSNIMRNYGTITGGGGSATVKLVIYRRALHAWTVVDDYTVQPKWATIKKRGSYGRANVSPV